MDFEILGLGTAVPRYRITQSEAAELAQQTCGATEDQARLLKVLYRRAGVVTRYSVVPSSTALGWMRSAEDEGSLATLVQWGPTTQERMQIYSQHAGALAVGAARTALQRSGVSPAGITHLVTVSCTGFAAPGVDIALIGELDLPATVERVQVGFMGCHGAINGLRVARALCAADSRARVLLCAVELCSIHY